MERTTGVQKGDNSTSHHSCVQAAVILDKTPCGDETQSARLSSLEIFDTLVCVPHCSAEDSEEQEEEKRQKRAWVGFLPEIAALLTNDACSYGSFVLHNIHYSTFFGATVLKEVLDI